MAAVEPGAQFGPKLRSRKRRRRDPARRARQAPAQPDAGVVPDRPAPLRGGRRQGGHQRGARTIVRVQELIDERIIRQVTPIFDTRALGYSSMLVAAKVDPDNPWRAANVINAHPGVSHNYLRNHEFNIWFTIATEPDSPLGLEGTLEVLGRAAGAESIRQLPTLKLFKIRMDLEMEGGTEALAKAVEAAPPAETERQPYDELDIAVIRAHPGRHARDHRAVRPGRGSELGMTQEQLLAHLAGHAGAPAAAPRRGDPLPPTRRLQRQRDGRVEGARRSGSWSSGPRMAAFRGISPLLPAPHLRGLAVLGLHDGPRPLEGGVRRDPRLDRRADRDQRARDALLLDRVQEDPPALLHRGLPGLGTRARRAFDRAATSRRAPRSSTTERWSCSRAGSTRPCGRCARSAATRSSSPAAKGPGSPTSTATSTSTGSARGAR